MKTSITFDMDAYWEDRLQKMPKTLKRLGLVLNEKIEPFNKTKNEYSSKTK
jgi:hypothetical protein